MGFFSALLTLALGCSGAPDPVASAAPAPAAPTAAPAPAEGTAGAAPTAGAGAGAASTAGAAVAPAAPVLSASTPAAEGLAPIRIGWQTSWATQGQLAAVLLHTDILAKNGFSGEFSGFTYGGPLNEGALAGGVDVLFTADQPALVLASKAPSWGIIGRLMYNRVGTFVPADSPVKTAKDLAGKRLAVPFGAAAQREAVGAIKSAGLDPAKDVKVVNLGVEEILGLVRAGARDGKWGDTDAAAAWDPTLAEVEHSGRTRTIASSTVTSVVVMNDAYVAAHPGADAKFMTAMTMAYDFYRQNTAQADHWFQQEAKLRFDLSVLGAAAAVEPNLSAKSAAGIRVHLTDKDVAGLTAAGAFMTEAGLLKEPLAVATVIRPVARTAPPAGDATGVTIVRP
jgi:sulfonate transport system substrate-binding protein